jgi:hypothetical protein
MRRLAVLAALLLVCAAAPALPQVPQTLSYQGVLTDNAGTLVPDGNYAITFSIFDVAAAGAALYSETHPAVPVTKGGFAVLIGSVSPLVLPFDRPYWLEIQVAPNPPLAPRVALAASPYALSLRLPFAGVGTSAGPALSVRNAGGGPALTVDGTLEVGATSDGRLNLRRVGSMNPVLRAYPNANGGNLDSNDELGNLNWFLESDAGGMGGFLAIHRAPGLTGFTVDGNSGTTQEPLVTISGATRSIAFDTDATTANGSVLLPTGAIAAAEIADETGVAGALEGLASLELTGGVQTVEAHSLTAPASGYVLAIGTVQVIAEHTSGTFDVVTIGIAKAPGAFPASQDLTLSNAANLANGGYSTPVTVQGIFPVSAGVNTFYLLAQETNGSIRLFDWTLSLVYLPTAYGTVTPPEAGASGDVGAPPRAALTGADVAAREREAERLEVARLRRESEAMRVELDALKRRLEASLQAQRDAGTARSR